MYNPVIAGVAFFQALQKANPEASLEALIRLQLQALDANDAMVHHVTGMWEEMMQQAIEDGWAVQDGAQAKLTEEGQRQLEWLNAQLSKNTP